MSKRTPSKGAIAVAAKTPGGWVYEYGGGLNPNGAIPREAILGAWQVDDSGKIIGEFRANPNYDPAAFPEKR